MGHAGDEARLGQPTEVQQLTWFMRGIGGGWPSQRVVNLRGEIADIYAHERFDAGVAWYERLTIQ